MLKQRVITAVVLLLVLLPALFYPAPSAFSGVALVLVSAGAWEWMRLNGYTGGTTFLAPAACLLLGLLAWAQGWLLEPFATAQLGFLAAVLWVLGGGWLLRAGPAGWSKIPRPIRSGFGIVLLMLAWIAVSRARVVGINFLLSILVLVWVADIGAYFAGRRFGGRFTKTKLAPMISPGKSWEGVWGGMACVVLLAFVWRWVEVALHANEVSVYSQFPEKGTWFLVLSVVFLASMSVVGDLLESLIKRSAGAKDSSNLLPGHGGVLDRLDALLPTVPLALLLCAF